MDSHPVGLEQQMLAQELFHQLGALYTELCSPVQPELERHLPITIEQVYLVTVPGAVTKRSWKHPFRRLQSVNLIENKKITVWWNVATTNTSSSYLRVHLGIEDGLIYAQVGPANHFQLSEMYTARLSSAQLRKLLEQVNLKRTALASQRENLA